MDAANIRAAYAQCAADVLTGDYTEGDDDYSGTLKQTEEGWQTSFDFPDDITEGTTEPDESVEFNITYDEDDGFQCDINLTSSDS